MFFVHLQFDTVALSKIEFLKRFQCHKKIIFHNSYVVNGKKVRFYSPDVMHNCTWQSEYFVDNENIVDNNSRVRETRGRLNGNNLVCTVCILCYWCLIDLNSYSIV